MNDLLSSGSFSRLPDGDNNNRFPSPEPDSPSDAGADLARFFEDVDAIKGELRDLESLHTRLHAAHEQSKTLHTAATVKDLRSRMDADVSAALKKTKVIKLRLEALDRSNAAIRCLPGRGPGSSSDRSRTSVVNGLRKALHDWMDRFSDLRVKAAAEYRETVQRRYFTVTGENPDEKVLYALIESGESEEFLQRAIQEQVADAAMEIQERHCAAREMEASLSELHQVFLDMAVLVQRQGEQVDDIESQVGKASSFVRVGAQQLEDAGRGRRSSWKWACCGIGIALAVAAVVVVVIVVVAVRPWQQRLVNLASVE